VTVTAAGCLRQVYLSKQLTTGDLHPELALAQAPPLSPVKARSSGALGGQPKVRTALGREALGMLSWV
jgi:hypothetical protein